MPNTPSTLYCLKCGYNLSGNTTNSCSECGAAFDPETLQADIAKLAGVTARRVFLQVFIPAMVLAVVIVTALTVGMLVNVPGIEYLGAILLVLGIPVVIYMIYNNWMFTHRLAFRRMTRSDTGFNPSRLRNFRLTCCVVLLLGQGVLGFFLMAGGCFGVAMVVMSRGGFIH